MKKRISITLSTDLLSEIDRLIGPNGSRSAFIEKVLSDHVRELSQRETVTRDKAAINTTAIWRDNETEDAPGFQQ
jgi:metal-responsive CopG/Arc/MetJ family transcriptional regulator